MVIQNKKKPKKGTKCFAISIGGGGGGGLGEGVSMVYAVCARILSSRTVKRSCASGDDIEFRKRGMPVGSQKFGFLAFEKWQGGVTGVGGQRQAGQTQMHIKKFLGPSCSFTSFSGRQSLHQLRVKLLAPLRGRPRRGSQHKLQVQLRAPLTSRPKQTPGQNTVESYGVFYTRSGPRPARGKMQHMILS